MITVPMIHAVSGFMPSSYRFGRRRALPALEVVDLAPLNAHEMSERGRRSAGATSVTTGALRLAAITAPVSTGPLGRAPDRRDPAARRDSLVPLDNANPRARSHAGHKRLRWPSQ